MPAKDLFHNAVKVALQKDGWTVTHDPLHLDLPDVEVYIDLGAEKLIAAERSGKKCNYSARLATRSHADRIKTHLRGLRKFV
jgi:XisH protein